LSIDEIISTYLKGWELGEGEMSLAVTADSFTYDDPNTGTIPKPEFVAFMNDFKADAMAMGAKENAKPFLEYSDVVIDKNGPTTLVWCWWQAVGTDLQGCANIKVSDEGVLHEKIAYFSKLP